MASLPDFLPDRDRNARKYERLLLALQHATEVLKSRITPTDEAKFEDIMGQLLPDLARAVEAQDTFFLRQRRSPNAPERQFEIIQPESGPEPASLDSEHLQELFEQNQITKVKASALDGVDIPGIVLHDAILAPIRMLSCFYVVGLCNKDDPQQYPFLTADLRILDYVLTPLITGFRAAEQESLEHQAIREISEQIATESGDGLAFDTGLWKLIGDWTTRLTNTKYAAIYVLDGDRPMLSLRYAWNADKQEPLAIAGAGPLDLDDSGSLNVRVANRRYPAYVADLNSSQTGVLPRKFERDVRSAFCAPLISRSNLVGTIYVASVERDGISQASQATVNRLARHVAVAVHNAQLFDQTQKLLASDQRVLHIQLAIANILQEKDQADQIHKVLQKHGVLQDGHSLFIATYSRSIDDLPDMITLHTVYEGAEPVSALANHNLYRPRQKGERKGLIDHMLACKLPHLYVSDFEDWPDRDEIEEEFRRESQPHGSLAPRSLKCCLVVELRNEEEIVGWLGLRGFERPHMFDKDLLVLLQMSAPHIAVVLANSGQYEERIRERKVVSDFQTTVSELTPNESAEVEQITPEMRKALEQLGLNTEDMYVALYDKETRQIRVPIVYINGRDLSEQEKAEDAAYQDRTITARHGFTEWILRNRRPLLARNAAEIRQVREQHDLSALPARFQSWLGVPMIAFGDVVGVMALRSSQPRKYTDSQSELLQTIANQTAVTIQNARQFQRSVEEARRNEALYEASQAITAAGIQRDDVLNTITKQAVSQTRGHLGMLYLKQGEHLVPVAVYSATNDAYHLSTFPASEECIVVLAIKKNRYQLVANVDDHPLYRDVSNGKTRSELAVVLRKDGAEDGEIIGVLNVEHEQVDGLTVRDRRFLVSLANMAVVAIDKSKREVALRRSNVVATTGAFGADVMHDVNRKVADFIWDIGGLRLQTNLPSDVAKRLEEIELRASSIQLPALPMTDALRSATASKEGWERPLLNDVLEAEIMAFDHERKTQARKAKILFQPSENVRVNIHHFWLGRLLRHFLMNADAHPPKNDSRQHVITIQTEISRDEATVFIQDNGCGVRPEIAERLFEFPIGRDGGVTGRGLLLVAWLCAEHGGQARLVANEPGQGARFAFLIPIYHGDPSEEESDNK